MRNEKNNPQQVPQQTDSRAAMWAETARIMESGVLSTTGAPMTDAQRKILAFARQMAGGVPFPCVDYNEVK